MNTNQKPENGSRSAGVGNVVEHAKEAAGEVVGQTKDKLDEVMRAQKDRATGSIDNVAATLRKTGRALEQPAEYVERAAERIERVGGYLRERSLTDLIGDAERFARREPAIFLGGAFTLGLLAARFLKSSSSHEDAHVDAPPKNQLIAGGVPRPSAPRAESLPGSSTQRAASPQPRNAGASPTSDESGGRNATRS